MARILGILIAAFTISTSYAQEPRTWAQQVRFTEVPVNITQELRNLRVKMKADWQGYAIPLIASGTDRTSLVGETHCFPIIDVPHTYFCTTYKQEQHNQLFCPMSVYSEGIGPLGPNIVVQPVDDFGFMSVCLEEVAGHDLPGKKVVEYFAEAENVGLAEPQKAFRDNVLRKILARENGHKFQLATAAIQGGVDVRSTTSHELLHMQYFLYPSIQEAAAQFWNEQLTEDDRTFIIDEMEESGIYAVEGEEPDWFKVYNEFFAHMLMYGAQTTERFRAIASRRADDLRSYVEKTTGITTIDFQD